MKCREGQIDCYGKKGMILLGSMEVQWATREDAIGKIVGGFQHKFCDYALKGYSGQDNVQVSSSLEIITHGVSNKCPNMTEIAFQSDKTTCFASQEHIQFFYHTNAESRLNGNPIVTNWIFA